MENAELYSTANGMQRRDAEEVMTEFCDKLNWTDGSKILDIGCGSGEVTAEILLPQLPEGFKRLVGLDMSQDMIQHARKLHDHPKVSFVQFDIAQESENVLEELTKNLAALENNNVDFKDLEDRLSVMGLTNVKQNIKILLNDRKILECNKGKVEKIRKACGYDVIVSFYCLHWVQNQRLAIRNIHKLLKPDGEALLVLLAQSPIFTLYHQVSKSPIWQQYMQDVERFISPYHHSSYPLDDFRELVKSTGFKIVYSECREREYLFDTVTTLKSAIKAVNPFITRIPIELQEEYIKDCLKQIEDLKLTQLKNDCYRVSYKLLVAHIRKDS